MLGIVEGAFTARSAAAPTTPVVVSVPHAGIRTAGYEETLNPELDVRGDADLFVDRLYRVGEPEGLVVDFSHLFMLALNMNCIILGHLQCHWTAAAFPTSPVGW